MNQIQEKLQIGVPTTSASGDSETITSLDSLTLRGIFIEHEGYVSDKWEHYLSIYEAAFSRFIARGRPIRLLEIGVQNGGSLQVWAKYLPEDSTIVGIDIDPECVGLPMEANVSIRVGDASDPVALDHILGDAEFDVIIDDGSHRSEHVIATFDACFRRLSPGGLYIIEDLHCSYYSSHGGGFRLAGTSIEWLKGLVDALNADHFEGDAAAALDSTGLRRLHKLGSQIAQVTFFDSVVIVEKLVSRKRQPYRRIRTGREARVVDLASDIPLMPTAQLQTLLLPASAAAGFAPALLNAVASAREEVGRLRGALAQAVAQHEGEMRAASERAEERTAEAEARLAEIDRLDSEISERLGELQQLRAAIEARDEQITSLVGKVAARDGEIGLLSDRIAALHDSTCWRITAPLRSVVRGARLGVSLARELRTRLHSAAAAYHALAPAPVKLISAPMKLISAPITPGDLREPRVKPSPIEPTRSGAAGEIIIRTAKFVAEIPWKRRLDSPDQPDSPTHMRYLSAKFQMLRDGGHEWADEFAAAVSNSATVEAEGLHVEALIKAIGITPLYHTAPGSTAACREPILQRYREGQAAATGRFRLDHGRIGTSSGRPTISILLPVYRVQPAFLERAILSVVCQTYEDWELCVVDDCSQREDIEAILKYYELEDRRIKIARTRENSGISATTNLALKIATGSYVGLFDHDDMLAHDALAIVASQLTRDSSIDLVYTDECKIDYNDIADELMCKPDWSPLLLTAVMYTGHFSVYRTSLVRELGGFRSEYDFAQDYDLALRVAEHNPKVVHIRQPLYGWRMISGSAAAGDKPTARKSNIAALQDAIDRRGWGGVAVALPMANRVLRTFKTEPPLVSLIVPSDNAAHISQTINSILSSTSYRRFEILVATKSSTGSRYRKAQQSGRVRFVAYDKPFNFSDKCNVGAAAASGDHLIFFNDDVRVISPDWIEAILECLTLPGVGVVGPKLLYEDGRIQHAGMVTGTRRLIGTAFHVYPSRTPACFNLAQSVREVSLISAACLAISKDLFNRIGGFDAENVPISHSDVDLCLRVRELGYSCLYTPHAELKHIGHLSIGREERKGKRLSLGKPDAFIMKRFGSYLEEDPFFPPALRNLFYIDSQEEFHYHSSCRSSLTAMDGLVQPSVHHGGADVVPDNSCRQKLDILILCHDLSASGAPRAAYDIARVLRAEDHFIVVASPLDGPYRQYLLTIGVDVIIDERLLKRDPWLLEFAANFDKVICNTIVCWPAVIQLGNSVSVYWYVHESELINHFIDNFPQFSDALRAARSIWANSRQAAKALAAHHAPSKILEVGTDDWSRLKAVGNNSQGKVVIGVIGSYEPRKGQDLAIAGMLQVPAHLRAGSELRLFGRTLDTRFRQEIEAMSGQDESIRFFEEVERDECLRQMTGMDIILVPSRDDALSLVALDALALGKTLVCSTSTGASSYLRPGESGLLLHHNTPAEIGQTLALAISDPDLRRRLGEGAREVYERNFTMEIFVRKLKSALGLDDIATDRRFNLEVSAAVGEASCSTASGAPDAR
jgi:GT2 family glycosyltransferase